jgi:hypothetical protein
MAGRDRQQQRISPFAGRWYTMFGPLDLEQQGANVQGVYRAGPHEGRLTGQIDDHRLHFRYQEAEHAGEGWFDLIRPGRIEGQWRQEGQVQWLPWTGERGYEGIWETSFGLLRLVHDGERVFGFYEGLGPSTIDGRAEGAELTLRYQEPRAAGEAHFTLADDGAAFTGEWRPDGTSMWQPWMGRRVWPAPGRIWLVVIEAHWQRHMMDKEYSFGSMLKEFFARVPGVQFCHRFFSNEAGLRRWCRDLMYMPEPTIVSIATHGTPQGLAVHGETVSPTALSETLRYADNIKLLHFSACLMMQEGPGMEIVRELRKHARFPISGYTTSVDWAASAIAEFTYFDLILARGMSPVDAAAELSRLLTFAGDEGVAGSRYPAAGFRMLEPPAHSDIVV